ncbi:MAG: hypothetical protein KAH20_15980 [Methylococcales bacterium]|nr:hypothetical protein [Methylococcales bacterium]
MVFAALYFFGLKSGVGANTLSLFFKMIRIDTHIGVSVSALQSQLNQMETLLPKFQVLCEKQIKEKPHKIIAGLDETFFGDFIILVLMDLRSGYLLLEDVSDDRCFDTWYEKTTPRLESLGLEVSHVISDRARALIKMAVTGFKCESGADVFHAQQDVSRWLGARLGKRLSKALKELESAKKKEKKAVKKVQGFQFFNDKAKRINAEKMLEKAQKTQDDYHENLQGISEEVHPFSLHDNSINGAKEIEERLENRAQTFTRIAQSNGIKDSRKVMRKFRNQFQPLAVSVTFWWLLVWESLHDLETNKDTAQWLTSHLLPVIYWHHKMKQTKNPKTKKKYCKAWEQASAKIKAHPFSRTLSVSDMGRWLTWAENMVRQFHRSSSAVEGRNGCLSQMYHNGRGLSPKRLKALTVIHNYGIKREDGTTAATRLFDIEFPDLFSWLLDEMGELPLPRKGRSRVVSNPLELLGVPS